MLQKEDNTDPQLLPYDLDAFTDDFDLEEEEEMEEEDMYDLDTEANSEIIDNEAGYDMEEVEDPFSLEEEEIEEEDIRDIFALDNNRGWDDAETWGGNEDDIGGDWPLESKKEKKKKSKHPLKKFRKERKNKKKKSKKKNKKRGGRKGGKKGSRRQDRDMNMFLTTEAPTEVKTTVAPQECTPETEGLLYFELVTSHMYRCNGRTWEKWGWGENYLQAAMVMDEPASNENKARPEQADCESGWHRFEKDCYRSVSKQVSWDQGEELCMDDGSHLTHVTSDRHLQWLWKLAGQEPFWTGLSARHTAGQWEYSDGSPVEFLNWRHGFPRNVHVLSKNCVIVAGKTMWVNRPCYRVLAKYICTKPLRSGSRRRRHRRVKT